MNKFEVIIPVINIDLMKKLLKSIATNTLLPDKIIIINNSNSSIGDLLPYVDHKITIYTYYSETTLVNESINLGITKLSKDCDYVSVLNDDIILSDCFFQRNLELLQFDACGIACPYTVKTMDKLKKGRVRIRTMSKREGWAVSMRKSMLDKIPLFPADRMATFHWDDWIWYHNRDDGLSWYQDRGNVIYHAIGSSVDKLGFKKHKKKEWNEFQLLAREKNWGKR